MIDAYALDARNERGLIAMGNGFDKITLYREGILRVVLAIATTVRFLFKICCFFLLSY